MEEEGIVNSVDSIYKNILEKFNPESKRMLTSAKAYLKALHSSSQASKAFYDSLAKLAQNANDSTPGTNDIGLALMDMIGIFNLIEEQHMSILKAFYVDFIGPLETNLDKDIKVIQLEQKKFAQQHKLRVESFNKATAAVKKHRKKKNNAEKELKCIQILEEEKKNLDFFCDQSYKNATIQERRRYGFILERCTESIAKHYLHFFNSSYSSLDNNIRRWSEVAATRELITPSNGGTMKRRSEFDRSNMHRRSVSDDGDSIHKIKDIEIKNDNLMLKRFSTNSLQASNQDERILRIALYSHSPISGENQLEFNEGDAICLIGESSNGWQFGENLKTKCYGWFPSSYVDSSFEKMDSNSRGNENDGTYSKYSSINKQRNFFQSPPLNRPPSPPLRCVEDVKRSVRGIYSSNDSGFSNEIPPIAPEVDYSDDDLPQKIPIRKSMEKPKSISSNSSPSKGMIKTENFMNKNQSNSYGDLTENRKHQFGNTLTSDAKGTKKSKTFWRFSKSEDILEGMSLWRHIDLLPTERDENTLRRPSESEYPKKSEARKSFIKDERLIENHNMKEKSQEKQMHAMESSNHDEDDIYDETPKKRNYKPMHPHQQEINNHNSESEWRKNRPTSINFHEEQQHHDSYKEMQDTNFYDDDDILRTVKRKEILKQYYSSETDSVSVNSDPYDSIFANDSMGMDGSNMSKKKHTQVSNTLQKLPRTKLMKTKTSDNENHTLKSSHSKKVKSLEPWNDLWNAKN